MIRPPGGVAHPGILLPAAHQALSVHPADGDHWLLFTAAGLAVVSAALLAAAVLFFVAARRHRSDGPTAEPQASRPVIVRPEPSWFDPDAGAGSFVATTAAFLDALHDGGRP